jgi:hypothetical protein
MAFFMHPVLLTGMILASWCWSSCTAPIACQSLRGLLSFCMECASKDLKTRGNPCIDQISLAIFRQTKPSADIIRLVALVMVFVIFYKFLNFFLEMWLLMS